MELKHGIREEKQESNQIKKRIRIKNDNIEVFHCLKNLLDDKS